MPFEEFQTIKRKLNESQDLVKQLDNDVRNRMRENEELSCEIRNLKETIVKQATERELVDIYTEINLNTQKKYADARAHWNLEKKLTNMWKLKYYEIIAKCRKKGIELPEMDQVLFPEDCDICKHLRPCRGQAPSGCKLVGITKIGRTSLQDPNPCFKLEK